MNILQDEKTDTNDKIHFKLNSFWKIKSSSQQPPKGHFLNKHIGKNKSEPEFNNH